GARRGSARSDAGILRGGFAKGSWNALAGRRSGHQRVDAVLLSVVEKEPFSGGGAARGTESDGCRSAMERAVLLDWFRTFRRLAAATVSGRDSIHSGSWCSTDDTAGFRVTARCFGRPPRGGVSI